MKTKIFSFLLILVAVQATVACRADAGEIDFPVACPVPPPDPFLGPEENLFSDSPTFFEDDFPDDVSDNDMEKVFFYLLRSKESFMNMKSILNPHNTNQVLALFSELMNDVSIIFIKLENN